jgi:hypothetical protein
MHNASTLLSWVLSSAPVSQPPPSFDVADVAFDQTADTAQVTALDSDGEVVAEIVFWADSVGQPMIAANFSDGLYMLASIDGDVSSVDTDDGATVHARLLTIQAAMPAAGSWLHCGLHVLAGAAACAVASVPCPIDAVLVACACLPKIVKEWEGKECP